MNFVSRSLLQSMITLISVIACCSAANGQDTEMLVFGDWLIKDGEQQYYKVRFDVFDRNGKPAVDFQFQFSRHHRKVEQRANVIGNRITARLSRFENDSFAELFVKSKDGKYGRRFRIIPQDLRHHCQSGVKIELLPLRKIKVRVIDSRSKPVANAKIIEKGVKTNDNGVAVFELPADEKPSRLMVLTPNGEVGREDLYQTPEKMNGNEFTIQTVALDKSFKQTLQVIDSDGVPVKNLLISPQARDRSIKLVAHQGFPIFSDDKGNAKVTWVPKLPGAPAFIGVNDRDWLNVAEKKTRDLWTIHVKRQERKKVSGKIELPKGIKGGFRVELLSYDHPTDSRVDRLIVRADDQGRFVANVFPGATYCVYVVDSRWSSSFWAGVPVDNDGTFEAPLLKIEKGMPIKIVATHGKKREPIVDALISVERRFDFTSRAGGGFLRAESRLQHKPNKEGIVIGYSMPGKVIVALRSDRYRASKEYTVSQKDKNLIEFHSDR